TEALEEEGLLRGVVHDPLARLQGGVGGSAGLFSTARDAAVFAQMLLNGGIVDGTRVFGPLTVRAMTTPQKQGRGYGFDISSPYANVRGDLLGPASFGHTGYTGPSVWVDPEQELLIVLMANRVHPEDATSVVPLRSKVSNVVAASITGPVPDRR
ncbi:MAG: serine hydrolase, partial [bacterium]